ncbi:MAG: glycerophosphodiester phosphodiesterase family protein [Acidobacteriota bacterium]
MDIVRTGHARPVAALTFAVACFTLLSDGAQAFEVHGHRGCGGPLGQGNTLAALERAAELGVDSVEIDVQGTADGALVVHHDPELARGCRRLGGGRLPTRRIAQLDSDVLSDVSCDGRPLPFLSDVLAWSRRHPELALLIEIKRQKPERMLPARRLAQALLAALEQGDPRALVTAASFDAEVLAALAELAPELPRCLVVGSLDRLEADLVRSRPGSVAIRASRLERPLLRRLQERGLRVLPWVVDEPHLLNKFLRWGVDGVLTDRPDLALRERAQPARHHGEALVKPSRSRLVQPLLSSALTLAVTALGTPAAVLGYEGAPAATERAELRLLTASGIEVSGLLLSPDGLVATSAQALEHGPLVAVALPGDEYSERPRVVRVDETLGLAVLYVAELDHLDAGPPATTPRRPERRRPVSHGASIHVDPETPPRRPAIADPSYPRRPEVQELPVDAGLRASTISARAGSRLGSWTPDSTPVPARPLSLGEVQRVAVYPFTSGGNVDTFLTSLFLREARKKRAVHQLMDPYELSVHVPDGEAFHAESRLDELREDARAAGADAMLIGVGVWYSVGFRLEARLIEVGTGRVIWHSAQASGMSLTGPRAKSKVVRRILRHYPRA